MLHNVKALCHCALLISHLTHDDGAINGQLQVLQGSPHNGKDMLHSVNLLTQEDVHGGQCTHFLQPCLHLDACMVVRGEGQKDVE